MRRSRRNGSWRSRVCSCRAVRRSQEAWSMRVGSRSQSAVARATGGGERAFACRARQPRGSAHGIRPLLLRAGRRGRAVPRHAKGVVADPRQGRAADRRAGGVPDPSRDQHHGPCRPGCLRESGATMVVPFLYALTVPFEIGFPAIVWHRWMCRARLSHGFRPRNPVRDASRAFPMQRDLSELPG